MSQPILFKPGTRNNNKTYIVRVEVNGERREKTTPYKTYKEAQAWGLALQQEMLGSGTPEAHENITFRKAAELYCAQRTPVIDLYEIGNNFDARSRWEAKRINRILATKLGKKPIREVKHADLVAAANELYGSKTAQTKNREVMRPAAAIYHYAEANRYCSVQRFSLFKEPRPETRTVPQEDQAALHAAVPLMVTPKTGEPVKHQAMRELLILWLFRQGGRISQTLDVKWDHIDLQRQVFKIYNRKIEDWQVFMFDPEVLERLAAIPAEQRHGRLWPWTQKTGVYRWTRQLRAQAGVQFTPHMARHTVGTSMNDAAQPGATIGAVLGHLDSKSTLRYTKVNLDAQRAAHAAAAAKRQGNG